ncbi:hypothetical protein [uncultured Muribaculum sp.]|nr:hypothetical protein [uncultured Muribaculum sp.]
MDITEGDGITTLWFDAACLSSYLLYLWDTRWCPPHRRNALKYAVLLSWITLAMTARIVY